MAPVDQIQYYEDSVFDSDSSSTFRDGTLRGGLMPQNAAQNNIINSDMSERLSNASPRYDQDNLNRFKKGILKSSGSGIDIKGLEGGRGAPAENSTLPKPKVPPPIAPKPTFNQYVQNQNNRGVTGAGAGSGLGRGYNPMSSNYVYNTGNVGPSRVEPEYFDQFKKVQDFELMDQAGEEDVEVEEPSFTRHITSADRPGFKTSISVREII